LDTMLGKLGPDPISLNFIIPSVACAPICLDQAMRWKMLRELPTLDDIDIIAWQTSDQSRGVHIPGTDATGGRRGADATSGSSKGKGKIAPSGLASNVGFRSPSNDIEMSFEEIAPLERKRRLICSDGFTVDGPSLLG
jgi:hypothetical protein